MQRLQVELISRLGGDEFRRRALHCLGNRLRVAEIVFCPLLYARTYFAGMRIVTESLQLAAEVMCADTGFHADQARRHCGEPRFDLAA